MLVSYAIGITAVVAVTIGWVVVQRRWRGTFLEYAPEADPLAARGTCHDCALPTICNDAPARREPTRSRND